MNQRRRRDTGARFLLVAASFVIVIAGLRAASDFILPFLVALFLAILSLPLLFWLQSLGLRRWIAATVTVLVVIAALSGVAFLVGGSFTEFTQQLPAYQRGLEQVRLSFLAWLNAHGLEIAEEELIDPDAIVAIVQETIGRIAAVVQNAMLVILTTAFILVEAAIFPAKLRSALGATEGSVMPRLSTVMTDVQRYLVIKTLISLATGTLLGLWCLILEIDYPFLWGLVAFGLNYIPSLGSILASAPPFLLALLQFGFGRALLVLLGYLLVNVTLGNVIEPNLMGRSFGLSTLVVFISLLFWGWVWGPVGMLLSVPLTMIVKIMLENTEDFHWLAVLLGPGAPGPPAAEPVRAVGVDDSPEAST